MTFSNPAKARTASDAYYSIIAARQDAFTADLASGRYQPFVYPWDTFAGALLLLAILVVPRLPRRHRTLMSIATFVWIVYFCLQTMFKARCLGLASGYGIGLMCSWGMIMSVVLLFCNDVSIDLQRIEWRYSRNASREQSNGQMNGSASTGAQASNSEVPLKRRVYGVDGPAVDVTSDISSDAITKPYHLVWQSYPSSIFHCIEWSADLMTTFRGVGWNWRIPTTPPLDLPIEDPKANRKPRNTATAESPTPTSVSEPTIRQLQLTGLRDFVIHYIMLDILKTLMITDPYFMGMAEISSPSPWPFLACTHHPTIMIRLMTRLTRLTICISGVLSALTFIFSLSPLFFLTILPTAVPPPYLQYLTRSPILEPSLYPPYWGPLSTVTSSGLAGLWGKWWHQLFRFGISDPSRALVQHLQLDPKGQNAKLLQLSIAFCLSGFIHASASFTTFSASKPLSGPFIFFVLQGVGIILQQLLTTFAKNNLYFAYRLAWLCRTANVLFVMCWFFITGPFFADDVARCGIWLFEPVPVSFFRGATWGDWWAWKNMAAWVAWHKGQTWYKSGLAIY